MARAMTSANTVADKAVGKSDFAWLAKVRLDARGRRFAPAGCWASYSLPKFCAIGGL
jgi:hypothetical protein